MRMRSDLTSFLLAGVTFLTFQHSRPLALISRSAVQ
jgi:hypothetical protein